ncbi:phytanoyl-CoA dioxygenase family protein [bacterium]|nr:phytanoyl-CoA dioxygenase family protein [bacterium]
MDQEFDKKGYKVFSGFQNVFMPVKQKLEFLFKELYPSFPPIDQTEAVGSFLTQKYAEDREEVLKIYDLLDRTFEMFMACSHPQILEALKKIGVASPIASSYPTWRLDLSNNPPSRWFPWHQDSYHECFAGNSIVVWAPLHAVGPHTKNSSLLIKEGSHKNGVYECGKNKFDIIDTRIHDFKEVSLDLQFGDFVVFNSYIVHRSGIIKEAPGMRLSLQFRYDDIRDKEYKKKGWPKNFKIVDAVDDARFGA